MLLHINCTNCTSIAYYLHKVSVCGNGHWQQKGPFLKRANNGLISGSLVTRHEPAKPATDGATKGQKGRAQTPQRARPNKIEQ